MKIIASAFLIGLLSTSAFCADLKPAINATYKFQSGPRICSAVALDVPGAPDNFTFLITAKHCIDPGHKTGKLISEKFTPDQDVTNYISYKVVGVSETTDLAGIVVISDTFKPQKVKLSNTDIEEGSQVWSIGYTLGGTRVTTSGYMGQNETTMNPMGDLVTYAKASTLIDQGNSGGGLFAEVGETKELQLVGIASLKTGANNFMNSFVSLFDIHKFLNEGA